MTERNLQESTIWKSSEKKISFFLHCVLTIWNAFSSPKPQFSLLLARGSRKGSKNYYGDLERRSCLYIQWLLINLQSGKSVDFFLCAEISCVPGKKGSENRLEVNFVRKKTDSPWKKYTRFSLARLKCCCLLGTFKRHTKFAAFFLRRTTKIPPFFQTWSLAHSQNSPYYVFTLWAEYGDEND